MLFRSETGIFRRLAASGTMVGGLALLSACGGNHAPRGSLGNPYHNGDTIAVTPGLTAKVVDGGGNILFSHRALSKFLSDNPHAEIDINMHNQYGNDQHIMIEDNQSLLIPDVLGEDELLECNPPAPKQKPCELTVSRIYAHYVPLPGQPKNYAPKERLKRTPVKGSPFSIFIQPDKHFLPTPAPQTPA